MYLRLALDREQGWAAGKCVTGTELVVWGGADRGVVLGDGAADDPVTDTSTPVATIDAARRRAAEEARPRRVAAGRPTEQPA